MNFTNFLIFFVKHFFAFFPPFLLLHKNCQFLHDQLQRSNSWLTFACTWCGYVLKAREKHFLFLILLILTRLNWGGSVKRRKDLQPQSEGDPGYETKLYVGGGVRHQSWITWEHRVFLHCHYSRVHRTTVLVRVASIGQKNAFGNSS